MHTFQSRTFVKMAYSRLSLLWKGKQYTKARNERNFFVKLHCTRYYLSPATAFVTSTTKRIFNFFDQKLTDKQIAYFH